MSHLQLCVLLISSLIGARADDALQNRVQSLETKLGGIEGKMDALLSAMQNMNRQSQPTAEVPAAGIVDRSQKVSRDQAAATADKQAAAQKATERQAAAARAAEEQAAAARAAEEQSAAARAEEEQAAAARAAEEQAAEEQAAEEQAAGARAAAEAKQRQQEVHNLYKDLADGKIDDPVLAKKVEAMVPSPEAASLLPTAKQVADKPKPKGKGKIGLKGFGVLKKKPKPAASVPAAPEMIPAMGVARGGDSAGLLKLDHKMKVEMLLKDLIRTVRLKRSRNILRDAFKDGKEENFDDQWRIQIFERILSRNGYTLDSVGNALDEFKHDPDVQTLRKSYDRGMALFKNLVMEESFNL